MKTWLPFLLLCSLALSCAAQNKGTAKVYGYKQGVLPGAPPKHVISENGREVNPTLKPKFNYRIYLVTSKQATPTQLWINGVGFKAQTFPVDHTPVEMENTNLPLEKKKTTLVPKTSQKVIQVAPGSAIEEKTSAKIKDLAQGNELLIVYESGGKTYYSTLKKLNPLEPLAAQ